MNEKNVSLHAEKDSLLKFIENNENQKNVNDALRRKKPLKYLPMNEKTFHFMQKKTVFLNLI